MTRDAQGPATSVIIVNGTGATPATVAPGSNAAIFLNKHGAAQFDYIRALNNNSPRWQLVLANNVAESGGNSGSNVSFDRFDDGGTFIDSPLIINRATGMVTINNLTAGSLSAPPSTPTSLALTGSLSVGTTTNLTGTVTAHNGINLFGSASAAAWYMSNNTARSYLHGMSTSGDSNYYICYDQSAGATRMYCNSAGNVVCVNSLTVSGNFNTNQIVGTVGIFSGNLTASGNFNTNGITGTTGQFNGGSVGIAGTNGLCYFTSNGVRAWYIGAINNGQFYFTDNSAGIVTCAIGNGDGIWNFQRSITVAQNATVSGSFFTNAISCAGINTNGNDITCHHPIVTDGVTYSNLGNHCIGFNNSGNTLSFWALGGVSGPSWTFNPSDERWKENIAEPEGDALADLRKLKLISFDLPSEDETPTRHYGCGFSAQNIESVTPDSISKITHPDGREQLVLDSLSLTARCVGAIQQLAARVEALEAQLAGRA